MARPVCKMNLKMVVKVCANVSGLTSIARSQDGDPRVLVLTKVSASKRRFEPGWQDAGRPLGHLLYPSCKQRGSRQLRWAARPISLGLAVRCARARPAAFR